jgi:hypothetical protein
VKRAGLATIIANQHEEHRKLPARARATQTATSKDSDPHDAATAAHEPQDQLKRTEQRIRRSQRRVNQTRKENSPGSFCVRSLLWPHISSSDCVQHNQEYTANEHERSRMNEGDTVVERNQERALKPTRRQETSRTSFCQHQFSSIWLGASTKSAH